MDNRFPTIEVLGVPVAKLGPDAALAAIAALYDAAVLAPALVVYANAHTLNLAATDPDYRALLRSAAIVLNDGSGIALGARIGGDRFPANLNGSDLNPLILGLAANSGWPVYLLGAGPGVAERAAEAMIVRFPALEIAGCQDGYWPPQDTSRIVETIRASGAALVMAALGNPLQEKWLAEHLPASGARIGVGVGAFFDFAAGEVARAPGWMNRWGIEWVFRLAQEPKRLWRRYVVGNPLFLFRIAKDRLHK